MIQRNRFTGILLLILFTCCLPAAFSQEGDSPVEFEASYVSDFGRNFGGIQDHFFYLGMIDLAATFHTEAAGLWKGGQFYIHVENTHGSTPTGSYVGDFQTFSNIEAGDNTCLYQLYYKQKLGRFTVLFGQHDLNSDFVATEYGGSFTNSSFGIMPNVSANVPVSIFPVNTLGVVVGAEITDHLSFMAGAYDGDPGDFESNPYSIKYKWSKEEGILSIGEFQYNIIRDENLTATLKFGGFYHSARFQDIVDTSLTHKGNYGVYGIADFVLLDRGKGKVLGAFLHGGTSPGGQNIIDLYLGGGLHYTGLIPGREEDVLAFAAASSSFNNKLVSENSEHMHPSELALELTYKLILGDHFELQPDLQYIINTGADRSISDASVLFLRTCISF